MSKRLIDPEEALAVKLNDIIDLQLSSIAVRNSLGSGLGLLVKEVLERILGLELVLGDEVVEVDKLNGNELLVLGQPCDLFRSLLDIALQMQLELEACDGLEAVLGERVDGVGDLADNGIAPVHERDFLVLGERLSISLLHDDVLAEDNLLGAKVVFGVLGLILSEGALACANNCDGDLGVFVDGDVARGGGLDVLLVGCPEGVPVKVDNVLGGTLLQNELLESGNDSSAAANTTDSGHARVIPAPDVASIDNLGQLALGEHSADKV